LVRGLVARWLRGYERYIVMALWRYGVMALWASQTKRYDVLLNSNVNRDMWCVMGKELLKAITRLVARYTSLG